MRLSDYAEEPGLKRGDRDRKDHPPRSAVVIARLLGIQGFNDDTANMVESYWRNRAGVTDRQAKALVELDRAIGELGQKLSLADRLVLGKFIATHKRMAFDSGLQIGLATRLCSTPETLTPEEVWDGVIPHTGGSIANVLATYHALVTGQSADGVNRLHDARRAESLDEIKRHYQEHPIFPVTSTTDPSSPEQSTDTLTAPEPPIDKK